MPNATGYTTLLSGNYWSGDEVTAPVFVTYSFATTAPASDAGHLSASALATFTPYTEAQKSQAREALAEWGSAGGGSGIVFLEVAPGKGDINFAAYDFSSDPNASGAGGMAYYPFGDWNYSTFVFGGNTGHFAAPLAGAGNVLMNSAFASNGLFAYATVLHEIGHALGLKHPEEERHNFIPGYIDVEHDQYGPAAVPAGFSIMQTGATALEHLTSVDLAAIQSIYGTATQAAIQDASWSWETATGTLTQVLKDGGQTVRGVATSNVIAGGTGNDTVYAYGAGTNTVRGNDGDDTLVGGGGVSFLEGGAGADTINGWFGETYASYANAAPGLTANLADPSQNTGDAANEAYIRVLNLRGSAFADSLVGDGNANILLGDAGADTLDGGGGADRLTGGADGDTYVVDSAGDLVFEANVAGIDTVRSAITFSLAGQFVENLVLTGTDAINGSGNSLDNAMTGNDAANRLNGGAGGNDTLDGGKGADTMGGGLGNDTYYVDNPGDQVFEAASEGTDLVSSSVTFSLAGQFIERLTLTGTNAVDGTGNSLDNTLTGNDLANRLSGQGGNDTLDGGLGADTMAGGIGNDTYHVDNSGDQALEATNEGTDLVSSTIAFSLAGQNIENLTLTGTAAINGVGNSLGNRLVGNDAANRLNGGTGGNDTLDGGLGADAMGGGTGNDIYYVDNAGDQVFEAANEGTDGVFAAITFSLAGQYVENLTLTSAFAIGGTGNSLANALTGNGAANALDGMGENDRIDGQLGADTLTGGAGLDTFVFSTALGAGNVDRITSFSTVDDTIELSRAIFAVLPAGGLAPSAFRTIGSGPVDGDDRILYDPGSGTLSYDDDGSGAHAATAFAVLLNKPALTAADILVV